MTRLLTNEEIEYILDFIQPSMDIPIETAKAVVKNNKNKLRSQLITQKVYPEIIPKLKEMMRKFRNQIETELRNIHGEDIQSGDELYQINLQFFRLTDQPWSAVSKEQTDTGARLTSSAELAADQNEIRGIHEKIT
jgi:hypothetical protein